MRLVSIASGSSGNCIYVGSERTHVLIDAGISNKRIEQGLNEIGLKAGELDGILITHEHSDHIKGLGVLARKHKIPIYSTAETLEEIAAKASLGQYPKELFRPILPDVDFVVGDLEIKPFRIDHDAANPVAYRVQNGRKSVAVATDMGHYDQYIVNHLQGLDALLLESNHDVRMLETGPYPYYLKRRILGDHGHLSNETCGRLLNCILHDNLKKILLGHLSKENNYEELAYETVRLEITQGETPYQAGDFSIAVAGRDRMSEIITV
ncbi:MAG TPA: MBL fold metallo-hydrolase [Candidatus Cottocaccamicrobium excrementipullorum]|nr:MBL fold metallo-hydrolase [Candidatus Cottocaccamicrobium excrementipullorum]